MRPSNPLHGLIIRCLAVWLLAVLLAALSVFVERIGPETVEYGNLCGHSGAEPCTGPVLNGGFPKAFLFDSPGISVVGQLHFVEDRFVPLAFVIDSAAYAVAIWLSLRAVARWRSRAARSAC
jgi:hypothetical protein